MIKDIHFSGLSTVPSDYECPDGQLSLSLNLISEDFHIAPVCLPAPQDMGLSPNQAIRYIHHPSPSIKHFILVEGNSVAWLDDASHQVNPIISFPAGVEIYQISSIGNTLIILCSDGIHYCLWKADQNQYISLGSKLPELSLSFGLQSEMKRTDEFEISFSIPQDDIYSPFPEDDDNNQKKSITEQVLAKVNKFIYEESTSKGKFIFPFFVRYAYRLYDGSLTMHSAPILMICSSGTTPRVFWFSLHGSDGEYTSANLRVAAPVHSLDYACISSLDSLTPWKDIIKSVDIFVSKPIYTYDQNGECEKFINGGTDLSAFSVCLHTNQAAPTDTYPLRYQRNDFGKLYAFTFTPDELDRRPGGVLVTPSRSDDAVKEDIRDCAQFYFLHSIPLDSLSSDRTIIPVKEDYLQSLVAREVMTDDYDSHDSLIASQAFPFNSRLNLSGINKILFNGFDGYSLFNFANGYVLNWSDTTPTARDRTKAVMVAVYIKQDGKDIVVYGNAGMTADYAPLLYFYYPNPNAYKAVIIRYSSVDDKHLVLNLEPHPLLNGAFFFNGWSEPAGISQGRPAQSSTAQRTIDLSNKVYTSEVNNPFFFPLLGINTVGTGKILGISTAAKALSQGQFGQFPLYAFTSEGVWALEVNSSGTYSARQPITRDVCIDPESITQIDSAVLFATSRGIMIISGSNTQCLTDTINSQFPFRFSARFPGAEYIHKLLHPDGPLGHPDDNCLDTAPFPQFLASCKMLYDYSHQRIFFYNPSADFPYGYIYSLKSKEWGMFLSRFADGLNAYPDAIAVDSDGAIVDFSSADTLSQPGILLSRPIKLEAPDVLKTVNSLIIRGNFAADGVATALFGSRDLIHWHLVWSKASHILRSFSGSPYKYYRILCVANLDPSESIFGASIQFSTRLTNRLR